MKNKFKFFNRKLKENYIRLEDNKIQYDFDNLIKDITKDTKFIFINDPCYYTGKKL